MSMISAYSGYPEDAMQPLTALIRGSQPDSPLARALDAILDSGLIIFSRDTEGHFVQLSDVLSARTGIVAASGDSQPRNLKVYDENGRLLPGSEYPAAITRTTGAAQREVLRRLVSDDGREIWLKMSTLPLERGPEGWSVLTVGTDVTDLQERRLTAEALSTARGALLDLSERWLTQPPDGDEIVDALREPLALLLPGANVLLAHHVGDEYVTTPVLHGYGPALASRRGRYASDQNPRWMSRETHVNPDVQDTDIYGGNVVAEYSNRIRSIVVAPCLGAAGRIGALAVTAPEPDAFSPDQIATIEVAAHIVGRAIDGADALARAS